MIASMEQQLMVPFAVPSPDKQQEIKFQKKKQAIHQRVVECLDVSSLTNIGAMRMPEELREFIERFDDEFDLTEADYDRLHQELPWEMQGNGPLEPLLSDPDVSDILVNHAHEVFVESHGEMRPSRTVFADNAHLMCVIQRIVAKVGRRIDESCPLVDARLADGSRVNAIIPPLALDGPKLSIRRFGNHCTSLPQLVAGGTLSQSMADFLTAAVRARQSILISGGTGAGKTTMLNALSSCIPADQRIVTIEDSAEMILRHPHVARLETRPANSEGINEYNQRDLVRNSLRMRPDRIIVGEVRGAEALDMLQAMNTGHEGSLTTIHANDAVDAISRLELMVAMTGLELPLSVVRTYICSGIKLVVHVVRHQGGDRRVSRISELHQTHDGLRLTDIFNWKHRGLDKRGRSVGEFVSGDRPNCIERFAEYGVDFDESIFSSPTSVLQ